MKLTEIGYWRGPEASDDLPAPHDFVDAAWDADERDLVVRYLERGVVVLGWMGFSKCRMCGQENGDLDLSDGHYIWPSGFAHYVREHNVRPPLTFVAHVERVIDRLEKADRDATWWKSLSSP